MLAAWPWSYLPIPVLALHRSGHHPDLPGREAVALPRLIPHCPSACSALPGALLSLMTQRLAPCMLCLNQRVRVPGVPAVICHFSKLLFVGVSLIKGELIRLLQG